MLTRAIIVLAIACLLPQAVAAVKPAPPSEQQIQRWIELLGHPAYDVRRAAARALSETGVPALEFVLTALGSKDLEVRTRAAEILRRIERGAHEQLRELGHLANTSDDGHVRTVALHGVSASAIELLVAFRNLGQLRISKGTIGDQELAVLNRLPSLRQLTFHEVAFRKSDVSFGPMMRLNRLFFSNCSLEHLAFDRLAESRTLNRVDLYETNVSDEQIAQIAKTEHLIMFALSDVELSRPGFDAIGQMRELTYLRLIEIDMPAGALDDIASMRLESLDLIGANIQDSDVAALLKMRSVKELNVLRTELSADGILGLRELPNLTSITLPEHISQSDVRRLRKEFGRKCRIHGGQPLRGK